MNRKSDYSRREFMGGVLVAGATLAFAGLVRGDQISNILGDFGIPLTTQLIAGPDDGCYGAIFSPVNDQVAFISGTPDNNSLFVGRISQPESFDLVWKPTTTASSVYVKGCAWSPNGKEIAILVQAVNNHTTPKLARLSIYVIDLASKAVREPVVVAKDTGEEVKHLETVSRVKRLAWWNESLVCVPATDGGILKFNSHTGTSEMLVPPQSGTTIRGIAVTRSGELRFVVEVEGDEASKTHRNIVRRMTQDGAIYDYAYLDEQLGTIFGAYLSQDGEFVFAEKHGSPPKSLPAFLPITFLIYKIETHSVIGEIPAVVNHRNDMYMYMPLTVQNDKELILIEGFSPEVDGAGSTTRPMLKLAKMSILSRKQYKTGED